MDATALLQSSLAIQIHAICAIAALALGTAVLLARKGSALHKGMGRVWIGLMLAVSLSSFFISEIRLLGPYSPIHALSILTLVGLYGGWRAARAGDVRSHRFTMIAVYFGGLIGAGLFTLVPGRIMHAVVFADGGAAALIVAALGLVAILTLRYGPISAWTRNRGGSGGRFRGGRDWRNGRHS